LQGNGVPTWVTNGCADNMSGTSEIPQLAAPLCATRKSAEAGGIGDATVDCVIHITLFAPKIYGKVGANLL
jgi:hypothetical protein